ncbi:MAG: putative porin [Candidatus Omnitrophota bacterium]|nr:putative porin [Candidatus Omnitrophota bacterium]
MRGLKMGVAAAALLCFTQTVFAGEIDVLVQKLVEKGILTAGEAQQIVTETKEEVKKEITQGTYETLPTWLKTIKLKGDFRLRYQHENRKASTNSGHGRNRGRFRLRLGAEAKVNPQVKIYLGLSSGGTDPRSTNQTFENMFELKDIRLDYVFAEYALTPWVTAFGGRMKNPLWEPGDLLWDTDIHPEGGAAQFNYALNQKLSLFANTGIFVLDDDERSFTMSSESDPFMWVIQPGLEWKPAENTNVKFALGYTGFNNVKGDVLEYSSNTNTRVGNALRDDYDCVTPMLEVGVNNPLTVLGIKLPYAGIFTEYVRNIHPSENNDGYLTGIKIGSQKIAGKGDWQFKYLFARLESNAWIDALPDSDRYGGGTGISGHEVSYSLGLSKNVSLDLDYYHTKRLHLLKNPENLFQVDLNFKF